MDIEQAFARLELPLDATEQQIDLAYRRLSKEAHPDSPSGDTEAQSLLNEARDTALAYMKIRGAVVPISPASLTHKIRSAIATYNQESAAETARNQFRRKTNYLNTVKWASWIIAVLIGVVGLAGNNLDAFPLAAEISKALKIQFQLTSVLLGLTGFGLQFFIKTVESRLEHFLLRISDKRECARLLAHELRYMNLETVSEDQLSYRSESGPGPFPPFRLLIDTDDGPILLQKSVEHNLLAPLEPVEITPDFKQTYALNFKPSLFEPPPPPPPKPRTISDVRSGIAFALGIAGFFGVISIALVYFGWGWWAAIPGVPALLGIVGIIMELTELAKLQQPDRTLAGAIRQLLKRWLPR